MFNMVLTAIVLLVLAACSPIPTAEPTSGSGLAGTSWVLVEIMGGPPVEGVEVTLDFTESEISGKACNNYFGSYIAYPKELDYADGVLSVSDLRSTKMACIDPADVMEQEQVYFNVMRQMAAYRITGDGRLILEQPTMDPCCLYFVLSKDAADHTNIVSGTSWVVTRLNGDTLLPDTEITMTFNKGHIHGSAGCNTYNTTYTLDRFNAIELGSVTITKKDCPDPAGVMEQEALFAQVLGSIKIISRYDSVELLMDNGDGTSSLYLKPIGHGTAAIIGLAEIGHDK